MEIFFHELPLPRPGEICNFNRVFCEAERLTKCLNGYQLIQKGTEQVSLWQGGGHTVGR